MGKTNIKLLAFTLTLFVNTAKSQVILKLQDCLDRIEQNSFAIKRASYEIELTKEKMNEAKKYWIPSINAYITNYYNLYSHNHDLDEVYFHLEEHDGNENETHNHSRHHNRVYSEFSNEIGIESNVLLYNFNTQKLRESKSKYEHLANIENLQLQKNINKILTLEKYFNVLISQELVNISTSNIENLNELLKITTRKYEVGVITKFELMQVKQEYYNAIYGLAENKLNLEKEKFSLLNFLQLEYKTEDLVLEPYSNLYDSEFLITENSIKKTIETYPSIKYEQNILEAFKLNTSILENNLKPKIFGNYSLGTNYFGSLNNLLKSESFTTQWKNNIINKIGVGITIPILNKYSDKSSIVQSRISESIQQNNIIKLTNELTLEVKSKYIEYENIRNLLEIEKERILISDEVYNMSIKAFDAGVINIYDVNKSRLDKLSQTINYSKMELQNSLNKEVLKIYLNN